LSKIKYIGLNILLLPLCIVGMILIIMCYAFLGAVCEVVVSVLDVVVKYVVIPCAVVYLLVVLPIQTAIKAFKKRHHKKEQL